MLRLLQKLKRDKNYENLLKVVSSEGETTVFLPSFARPLVVAGMFEELKKPIIVLTATLSEAEEFFESLSTFTSQAVLFPDREILPKEDLSPNKEILAQRAKVLYRIQKESLIVVMGIKTFIQGIPFADLKRVNPLNLKVGQKFDFYELNKQLVEMGYERASLVESRGEFSVRGGIIDIFDPLMKHPLRAEFFGDEVVSLRQFSIASQRSVASCNKAEVFPCHETALEDKGSLLLECFKDDSLVIFNERKRIDDEAEIKDFLSEIKWRVNFISVHLRDFVSPVKIEAVPPNVSPARFELLKEEIKRLKQEDFLTLVILSDKGRIERLSELFLEWGISFNTIFKKESVSFSDKGVYLVLGYLKEGFVLNEARLAVLGESDIFRWREKRRILKQTKAYASTAFIDFSEGDYVVHSTHGIARYSGLCQQEVGGNIREYLTLHYAEGDKLFVPVEQLNRVSKYIGSDGSPPKVSRLNNRDWLRTKKRASESAKKLAIDLMKLYSLRESNSGFPFFTDAPWQRELEDSFPFEETPDQLKAIEETKKDMEEARPMDRLICGDVGYGKTEVAIRGAFKAVMSGKQVMVLTPTTILAEQHHFTFLSRFAAFPVSVEVLSRFKTRKEQGKVLLDFALGKIDVLIGTHRLLQKDVQPRDLGLVIIDEEQRFGVAHKEHLKSLRETVDVLTLTATPIPRTLQMALTGLRDISIINTPPEDRLPVFTCVGEHDETVIQNVVRRELNRGGQVYYVFNRVETIDEVAEKLRCLIPEAQVVVAHGQMSEAKLEKVMQQFLVQEYDVLVCTTIIESGIDIPTVNTLIVEEADMFGLSTLYQLRGRVGRSNHRAYAYFFYSPQKLLTFSSSERLKTIAELTELGSGFKVAMRDLEIRGAGNLLGPEQHGHIAAVGFDLYCELVRQAVQELKGEKSYQELKEVKVDLPVSAYIPPGYIESETLRIEAYRRLALIKDLEALELFKAELVDRYGHFPFKVKNLINVCQVKILAGKLGIKEISFRGGKLNLIGASLSKEYLGKYPCLFFDSHRGILSAQVKENEALSYALALLDDMITLLRVS